MHNTIRWLKIETIGQGPSPRAAGSCTRINDNELLFFGGYCADDNIGYYNDIFIFNLSTLSILFSLFFPKHLRILNLIKMMYGYCSNPKDIVTLL
jgi:hypothetical protein